MSPDRSAPPARTADGPYAPSRRGVPPRDDLAAVRAALERPDPADRPLMRWWWFGPDLRAGDVDRELAAMAAAGLGGAEVSVVYPLREGSPGLLDPETLAVLRHAAHRARDLGLRLDLTIGSGWSYGGPHLGPEHASRHLRWERRDLSPAPRTVPLRPGWPEDALVGAWVGEGFPARGWTPAAVVEGVLHLERGRGPRTVLLAWSEPTGQQVKRACAGQEGPVLDHLSAAAVRHHLAVVGDALLAGIGPDAPELIGSVFCDSLEVYDGSWTADLPAEFRARRGYDLLPVLHRLVVDEDGAEELRGDVQRTLSELVEERFVAECRAWAAGHGIPFRLQGYGEPPITLSAQQGADLIEGEGAGWRSLTQSRWASSAAHLAGREVVSSEVWTWVHSPSFRATPLDLQGEAHEHLLLGITRFVGHGWPHSPADADGVGWTFYAAGALDDRNAWWPAMRPLMTSLARLGAALRRGDPAADVLLLLPEADARAGATGGLDLWRRCRELVGEEIPAVLREAGYDYEAVDEEALLAVDPAAVPVVLLPRVRRLSAAVRERLDAVRAAGGTVIAVDSDADPGARRASTSAAEGDPGEGAVRPLLDVLAAVCPPPLAISGGEGEIGVVRRRLADGDLFLLANTGPEPRRISVVPREARAFAELADPRTGRRRALPDAGRIELEVHPYQAVLLLVGAGEAARSEDAGQGAAADPAPAGAASAPVPGPSSVSAESGAGAGLRGGRTGRELAGDWTFIAPDGNRRTVVLPHRWEDEDPAAVGTGVYERDLVLDAEDGIGPLVLDLGAGRALGEDDPAVTGGSGYRVRYEAPVREVAEVSLDGQDLGILWAPPYRVELPAGLDPGTHRLRIAVSGTTAPAVAADPHAARTVAAAHAAYGERFQQQDLAAILDGVSTGLQGVPVLRRGGAPD